MSMKDLTPTNDKGQAHGYYEVYNDDGDLYYKCTYVNGQEVGYDEIHFTNNIQKQYIIR